MDELLAGKESAFRIDLVDPHRTPPARAVFWCDVRFCSGCSHEQQQTHPSQASRFQRQNWAS
ncbi:hypothetical protein, partial [Sedimentitalea todarodis]